MPKLRRIDSLEEVTELLEDDQILSRLMADDRFSESEQEYLVQIWNDQVTGPLYTFLKSPVLDQARKLVFG